MKGAIIPCSSPVCHNLDWKKQLSQAVSNPEELLQLLNLTSDHVGKGEATRLFSLRVPRAYVERMEKGNPDDPLFRQVWPDQKEFKPHPDFIPDPLQENEANPVPGLLHKYGTRVLTISAASCAINCRYCFRRNFAYQEQAFNESAWEAWIDYIAKHPEINEVILSGGEPLLIPDDKLQRLTEKLEAMPQIRRLRIHSRLPLVIPDRITDAFLSLAERSRLDWLLIWHINHPNEIDHNVKTAAARCRDAGIRQFNQSVILKKVNDCSAILSALSERLFDSWIQPYYLHLLDRVTGIQHFEVPEDEVLKIYQELLAQLPGFLVPRLVREEPRQPSKTPVV